MLGTGCLAIDVPLIQGGRISDLHPEKAFHMKNHWRTSVFLITTILLILASAFSGCGRSPEARRNRYLEAGKKMLAQKDYDRAIIEFKNAVSAMPKDPESHYQLAVASDLKRGGTGIWKPARRCSRRRTTTAPSSNSRMPCRPCQRIRSPIINWQWLPI